MNFPRYDQIKDADLLLQLPKFDAAHYIGKWAREVVESAAHKEVADLSEEEKFCIAFLAGVPLAKNNYDTEGLSTIMKMTTVPCAITKIDGKFHVAYQEDKK